MEDMAEIDAETQRMVAELAENPESIEILQEPEEVS